LVQGTPESARPSDAGPGLQRLKGAELLADRGRPHDLGGQLLD